MKAVKYLIVFVLTALFALLIAISPTEAYLTAYKVTVTTIYALLIYLVWPIGTNYSQVLEKRFYFVLSMAALLIATNVIFTGECPSFPFSPVTSIGKSQGLAAILLLVCSYVGKIPTALLLCLFSGRLFYLGCKKATTFG